MLSWGLYPWLFCNRPEDYTTACSEGIEVKEILNAAKRSARGSECLIQGVLLFVLVLSGLSSSAEL